MGACNLLAGISDADSMDPRGYAGQLYSGNACGKSGSGLRFEESADKAGTGHRGFDADSGTERCAERIYDFRQHGIQGALCAALCGKEDEGGL